MEVTAKEREAGKDMAGAQEAGKVMAGAQETGKDMAGAQETGKVIAGALEAVGVIAGALEAREGVPVIAAAVPEGKGEEGTGRSLQGLFWFWRSLRLFPGQ